ncbi:MAG TPA: O-antigen ligase family protein [Actinomycetota bacterium]|nr:O-antigen ligase family protein [Actinomycetota bacterium]
MARPRRAGGVTRAKVGPVLFGVALGAGLVCWLLDFGFVALWLFAAAAGLAALILPLPYALASPLFMGLFGWLVDMLPFVILFGWGVVVLRWVVLLARERRLPRGRKALALAVFLVVWTAAGVVVISLQDIRGFLLLVAIQVVLSGVVMAVVDQLRDLQARLSLVSALVVYAIVLSLGVLLQWGGVNLDALQDRTVAARAEAAYGLDAFPNNLGMIKWARATESGAGALRERLNALAEDVPDLPSYRAFRPKFAAYPGTLLVRFDGSARAHEERLREIGVTLAYDNIGMAPANTVPRMRSFPRNALTFAGVSAALFPLALGLGATGGARRRLGWVGVVATLFGAGFSLARGAWIAILIGIVYLALDARVERVWKVRAGAAFLIAGLVLSATYLVKYGVDPVTGRAGGGASVNTRGDLYGDTLASLRGVHIVLGYGTTQARTETGTTRGGQVGRRYVPRAGTHSTYLNYLFRTGLPGAAAILGLYALAALGARARNHAPETPDAERRFAAFAAAATVTAAAHAVILSLYVEPVYTLTIGLVLGIAIATAGDLDVRLLPRRWRRG